MVTLVNLLLAAFVTVCIVGIVVVLAILEIPFKTLLGFKQEKNWWNR